MNLRQVSDSVKHRLGWRAETRQSFYWESGYCKETETREWGKRRRGWTQGNEEMLTAMLRGDCEKGFMEGEKCPVRLEGKIQEVWLS